MKEIEAIETEFACVRFRSRLEARWAIFFSHLAIKWRYEPDAYKLSNGDGYHPICYKPDFKIDPQSNFPKGAWFECKPNPAAFNEEADLKAGRLAMWSSGRVGILFPMEFPDRSQYFHRTGATWSAELDALDFRMVYQGGDDWGYSFCECPKCGAIGYEHGGKAERIGCGCNLQVNTLNNASPRILSAIKAPLWERFEIAA